MNREFIYVLKEPYKINEYPHKLLLMKSNGVVTAYVAYGCTTVIDIERVE